jgi:peptide/nickel transport system permease protein
LQFLRPIGDALITVWAVLSAVFFITHTLGDPATLLLPVGASQADLSLLRQQMGLDLPIGMQYLHFIGGGLLHGNLGDSFIFARPAMSVVLERLPATLELALTALFLAILFGSIAGCVLATNRGPAVSLLRSSVVLAQATPVFVLGFALILLFAVHFQVMPAGGRGGLRHLLLPALSMAVYLGAQIARVTESSVEQVAREPYVLTARMKGLRPTTIFTWYILRNALFPILTILGILIGETLGGAVVIETVFAWPGIGRLTFQAIQNGDIPLVSAAVLLSCVGVTVSNLSVDLLYLWLDPRTGRTT